MLIMAMEQNKFSTNSQVLERTKLDKPPLYQVFLLNDDYTPMDFVVEVLISVFFKTPEEATKIMLNVHVSGKGLCGKFPKEIAQIKVNQVMSSARQNQHPLQCIYEKE